MALPSSGALDALLEAAVDDGSVLGAVVAAADRDGETRIRAAGRLDAERDAPMRADSLFRIASMTKAVTSVAVMQLVERGAVGLDDAAERVLPELRGLRVLEGFDGSGAPRLRAPAGAPTVRQLLSHTAGYAYEMWSAPLARLQADSELASIFDAGSGFLDAPLVADPGARWSYGINTDWLGVLVERVSGQPLDAYFAEHVFAPLGMRDSAFAPPDSQLERIAAVGQRTPDGGLAQRFVPLLAAGGFNSGGGGLVSSAGDYLTFLRALLGGGSLGEVRILAPQSVEAMATDQLGALEVERLVSTEPATSNDVEFWPGLRKRFGLGFLINAERVPGGRAAGSYAWAGLFNSYYWVDPASGVCALLLTQVLPFFDAKVLALLDRFERAVYAAR